MVKYRFKGLTLSEEQTQCLDLFSNMNYGETLGIEAGAGASKTFTLNSIANKVMANQRGIYLAYNSAIVAEVKRLFPNYVDVTTTHGLAYRYVGKYYESRLKRKLTINAFLKHYQPKNLNGLVTPQGYASAVMRTISRYCLSKERNISECHIELHSALNDSGERALYIKELILKGARLLWADMANSHSHIPTTHDAYLKLFVLKLQDSSIELPYTFAMLDEAQDSAPITQLLISLLRQAKKAIVGDRWQSIYEWRGADNAMQNLGFDHTAELTTCYRFGQDIADLANHTLNLKLNANVNFKGNVERKSQIYTERRSVTSNTRKMLICRTNSTLFKEMMDALANNRSPYLVKDAENLHNIVQGVMALKSGKAAECDELAVFSNWEELKEHSESEVGKDFQPMIRAVEQHGTSNLLGALDTVRSQPRNRASELLTTGHSSKGAEADYVELAGDFDNFLSSNDTPEQEYKLLYVALTRAKLGLDVSQCSELKKIMTTTQKPFTQAPVALSNPSLDKLNALLAM